MFDLKLAGGKTYRPMQRSEIEEAKKKLKRYQMELDQINSNIQSSKDDYELWLKKLNQRIERSIQDDRNKINEIYQHYTNSPLFNYSNKSSHVVTLKDIAPQIEWIIKESLYNYDSKLPELIQLVLKNSNAEIEQIDTIIQPNQINLQFRDGYNGVYNFIILLKFVIEHVDEYDPSSPYSHSLHYLKAITKPYLIYPQELDKIYISREDSVLSQNLQKLIISSIEQHYENKLNSIKGNILFTENLRGKLIKNKRSIHETVLSKINREKNRILNELSLLETRIEKNIIEAKWLSSNQITASDISQILKNEKSLICNGRNVKALNHHIILIGGDDNFVGPEKVPEQYHHQNQSLFNSDRLFDQIGAIDLGMHLKLETPYSLLKRNIKCFMIYLKGRPENHSWVTTDDLIVAVHRSNDDSWVYANNNDELKKIKSNSQEIGLKFNKDFVYSIESTNEMTVLLNKTHLMSLRFQDDTAVDWIQIHYFYD